MKIPKHIGIIMDGNGRWAKQRGLPRSAGHKKGVETLEGVMKKAGELGVEYVTLYAFSTENQKRPSEEVKGLFELLRQYLKRANNNSSKEVRSLFIGDLSYFPDDIVEGMKSLEEKTKDNDKLTIVMAVNYGGRDEIAKAVKNIASKAVNGEINASDIDETLVSSFLYTKDIPDPDLIIRPSGEKRISNFLLWQMAYSEFVFMDILWPDFKGEHLEEAISEYSSRDRRYGKVEE